MKSQQIKIPQLNYNPSSYWLWFGGLFFIGTSLNSDIINSLSNPLFWSYSIYFFFATFLFTYSNHTFVLAISMLGILLVKESLVESSILLIIFSSWLLIKNYGGNSYKFKLVKLCLEPMIYLIPLFIGINRTVILSNDALSLIALYSWSLASYLLACLSDTKYFSSLKLKDLNLVLATVGILYSIASFYLLTYVRLWPWSLVSLTYPAIIIVMLQDVKKGNLKAFETMPIITLILGISIYLLLNLNLI